MSDCRRYINERVEERAEERVKECRRTREVNVEERVKERVEKEKTLSVQNLHESTVKWTLDQTLTHLELRGRKEHLSSSSCKNNKSITQEETSKGVSFLYSKKRISYPVLHKIVVKPPQSYNIVKDVRKAVREKKK